MTVISGYTYGAVDASPVTTEDLALLETTVLWSEEDGAALAKAAEILEPQVEDILDVWYGFVASHPHLLAYFSTPAGEPIQEYLDGVRPRFGRWILDTCLRPRDSDWLAYQHEIALRHTPAKKNTTDAVESVSTIPLRYVLAFIYPITATMRQFLANGGHSTEEVEAMYQAWFKSVVLQVTLWARAYAPEEW